MSDSIKNSNEFVNSIFAGKTIESVDATAVNCWDFYFRDGTKTTLEVEAIAGWMGLYGISIVDQNSDPDPDFFLQKRLALEESLVMLERQLSN